MQIVIDIPEEEYNIIKKTNAPMTWAEHLIAKGTPLPKGHGNLIQREEAETIFRNAKMALYKQSRIEQIKDFQTRESMLLNAEQLVHLIKPIIEADKAESDAKNDGLLIIDTFLSAILTKDKEAIKYAFTAYKYTLKSIAPLKNNVSLVEKLINELSFFKN
jgi:hypothetical protein